MTQPTQAGTFFVRLPNGNGCVCPLSPTLTPQKLTSFLEKTALQLPTSFRLIFQGRPLQNYASTLVESGVTGNSIVHIEPVLANPHRSSRIDVAFLLNGDKFVVQESSHKTVWELKIGIGAVTGINPSSQTLVFLGKRLKDHRTLSHYKLTSDSLLCLLIEGN
jgi:hypothetical protein